jgi:FtsH-binding integral membrane protein
MAYAAHQIPVAKLGADARGAFIAKTYTHLAGAILAFVALEFLLFQTAIPETLTNILFDGPGYAWLGVLVVFMAVGALARWWAHSVTSAPLQYLGLAVYIVAETIIFIPLLYIAATFSEPDVIPLAGVTTLIVFTGLTAFVLITRKNFSFMRGVLGVVSLVAIAAIVGGVLFGFELGLWFSLAMVGLAAGYVLYYTSAVLHEYGEHQYVAASLALFAAIALMFWYILRIFMNRR